MSVAFESAWISSSQSSVKRPGARSKAARSTMAPTLPVMSSTIIAPDGLPRPSCLAFVLSLVFYAAFFSFTFHEADEDLWGRMAAGRLTLSEGQRTQEGRLRVRPDETSLGRSRVAFGSRLSSQSIAPSEDSGLMVLRAALGVGTVALLLLAARGANPWTVAVLSLAAIPAHRPGIQFRGASPGLHLPLLRSSLSSCWSGGRDTCVLLPLVALWANLHGGFVIGPLLILAYGFFRLAAGCLAVSVLNPYGLEYWRYLREALSMPRPGIVEWRSAELGGLGRPPYSRRRLLLVLLLVRREAASPRASRGARRRGTRDRPPRPLRASSRNGDRRHPGRVVGRRVSEESTRARARRDAFSRLSLVAIGGAVGYMDAAFLSSGDPRGSLPGGSGEPLEGRERKPRGVLQLGGVCALSPLSRDTRLDRWPLRDGLSQTTWYGQMMVHLGVAGE